MSKEKENKISKNIIDNILDLSIEKINTIKEDIKDKSFEESIEYFKNHKIIKCFIDLFPLAKEGFEDYMKYRTSSKNRKYEDPSWGNEDKNNDVSKDKVFNNDIGVGVSNDQFIDRYLVQVENLIIENMESFDYLSQCVISPIQAELVLLGYNEKIFDELKSKDFFNTDKDWKKMSKYPFIDRIFKAIFKSYVSQNIIIEKIRRKLLKIYFLDTLPIFSPILKKYPNKKLIDEKVINEIYKDLDEFNEEVCRAFDSLLSFLIEKNLIDLTMFKKDSIYLKLSLKCYGFEISRILDAYIENKIQETKEDTLFFKLKESKYLSNVKEIFERQWICAPVFDKFDLEANKNKKDKFYDESIMKNYPMFAKLFEYYATMFSWENIKNKEAEMDKIRNRLLLILAHEISYRYFASYPEDDDKLINLNIEKIKGYVEEPLEKVFNYLACLYHKDYSIDAIKNQLNSINYDNLLLINLEINIFKK